MYYLYRYIMTSESSPKDSSILFNALKFDFVNGNSEKPNINLASLKDALNAKDNKVSAVLTKQKQVNNILNSEITRLEQKKSQLVNAQKGQRRVLMMNESYRKRQQEYTKLIIAVVVVFALVLIMRYMRVYFNVLPESVYTLLHILLFVSVIIYSGVIYVNVSSREKINFDRLSIPGPIIEDVGVLSARNEAAKLSGNLLGISDSDLCKGAACCTKGVTSWNETTRRCVVPNT